MSSVHRPGCKSLAELVEFAAEFRADPAVPREFIDEALRQIRTKEARVDMYRGCNLPSLVGIYRLATELQAKSAAKH